MKATIIIPTFNEAANIRSLVEKLLTNPPDITVCIVDDNSPDGTGQIADQLAKENSRVHVIHRQAKDGRGGATLEGFQYALKGPADYILEMDADFSHDPADIPRLLAEAPKADVIIGSRYLPGSEILNWPLSRRIFSRLSNAFARFLLQIPISDYTNGYRCYSRRALQNLESDKIKAKGYIVLSCIAYQLHKKGFTFRDIPIRFVNRKRGTSNLSFKEIYHAFTEVLKVKRQFQS